MKREQVGSPGPEVQRCAIYTRKSTSIGLEKEFNSLDAQEEACRHFILSQKHLGWEVVSEVFSDGGFTGANINRPAFARLLRLVRKGEIDVVVVYKVDRLSRSLMDFAKIMELFGKHQVAFVSITQNFSTANALGRLTLNMLMSFSEFEREIISERTRDKIEAARRKGKWTGGPPPLGYLIRDRKLVVVPGEVPIVRGIFDWSIAGHTPTWIAKQLNDVGVCHRSLLKPRSRPWNRTHVLKILRNKVYAGLLGCRGGDLAQGEHEGILPLATFEQAQIMLSPAVRRNNNLHLNPAFIARGVLVCAGCQAPMTTSVIWHGFRLSRYYRCASKGLNGKGKCPFLSHRAEALEALLVERLCNELGSGLMGQEILMNQAAHLRRERRIANREVKGEFILAGQHSHGGTYKLATLDGVANHLLWFSKILSQMGESWPALTLPERNGFLRTIFDRVVVHEPKGRLDIVYRDFSLRLFVPIELGG